MSDEPELTAVVDPDAPPAAPPTEPPPAAPVADDLPPELPEQDRVAAAFNAMRREIQELRPLKSAASEAERLRAELAATQPYVEFLKANPQLLQPPQPAPQAAAPAPAGPDPQLVEYARTLDLYDASGQPDTARAAKLRDLTAQQARQIAQEALAPVAEQTNEQRAGANLTAAMAAAAANGTPIDEQYLTAAVRSVTGQVPRAQAVRILADPNVTNLLTLTALGLQAAAKKGAPAPAAPAAQPGPVLEVERPGGAPAVRMSDESRKLFAGTGIGEEKYVEAAKRYVPGKSNSLE